MLKMCVRVFSVLLRKEDRSKQINYFQMLFELKTRQRERERERERERQSEAIKLFFLSGERNLRSEIKK